MLNLTGTEYRPDLAKGYKWCFDLSPSTSHITVEVKNSNGLPIFSTAVDVHPSDTAGTLRNKVLRKTEEVASMIRPWNPTYAPMALEVLHSLTPPKDAVVRTSDEPLAPPRDPNEPRPRT